MKKSIIIFSLLALTFFVCLSFSSCNEPEPPIIPSYTVTFDSNGGSSVEPQTVSENEKLIIPQAPTKLGYDFSGWFYQNAPWSFNSDTVTEDITLIARWTPTVYTVSYNNLRGFSHTNPTSYTIEDADITISPLNSNGIEFLGWFDQDGNKVTAILSGSNGNLVLTARWSLEHTVTFNTGSNTVLNPQIVNSGAKVTEPPKITKEHYKLVGWFCGDTQWNFDTDAVTDNITLSAKWEAIKYEAKFYSKGALVKAVKYTVEDNGLPEIPNVPSINGYTGVWQEYSFELGGFTVEAIYTPIQYSITYINKFNTAHSNKTAFTVETESFEISAPQGKAGYTFEGWFDDKNRLCSDVSEGTYGSLTLTAVWTLIEYTIEYTGTNGAENNNPTVYTVESDDITLLPLQLDGFTFVGWKNELGQDVTTVKNGSVGDIILSAKWDTYTVTTAVNDSKGGTCTTYTAEKISAGTPLTLTATPNLGYTFNGWYKNGVLVSSSQTYSFTMREESVVLIANFSLNQEMSPFIFTSTPTSCIISGCNNTKITEITIPSYVTKVNANAFKGIISITSVTVLSPLTDIDENAFWCCIGLSEITVGSTTVAIKTSYTWEEYNSLSGSEQESFFRSFLNPGDFYTWKNLAKTEYDNSQDREEIGGDGEIDLG